MTRRLFFYIPAALFAAALLLYRSECAQAAGEGAALCAKTLIPALFPFFVLSAFLLNAGLASDLSRLFSKTKRGFFGLPGACAVPFILGALGGYPVGAASVCALYDAGLCTKREAGRALFFCSNCGAAFTLAVCPALFGGKNTGAVLLLSHLGAALVLGALSAAFSKKSAPKAPAAPLSFPPPQPFGAALSSALASGVSQTASVCACVVFFFCVSAALKASNALGLLSRALYLPLSLFGVSRPLSDALARGVLEMTNGVYALSALSTESEAAKICAAAAVVGFGGFSVHLQALSPILRSRLSPRLYFAGKALHAAFGVLFARLLLFVLK
ncbi:MAG: sporulation protein [Clostridia bacterium]|nr:sporulation protein [Clostridia bacterium]